MAGLNPILAMRATDGLHIELLATVNRKSRENASITKKMLEALNGSGVSIRVNITTISNTLTVDSDGNLPAHLVTTQIVSENPREKIYFNTAGGMNFQVAACTSELMKFSNVAYLYPDNYGINVFVQDNGGKIVTRDMVPVPEVRKILDMQGIRYKQSDGALNPIIKDICRKSGITLPRDVLKNVEIEGIFFDFVMNRQNTLCFCKLMHNSPEIKSAQFLASVRELIDFAINRQSLGYLAHHKILVLTNSGIARERFFTESLNKIDTVRYGGRDYSLWPQEIQAFQAFFQKKQKEKKYNLRLEQVDGKTLFAFLGTDAMPALKTLWSFQGKHVCLFYTPDNPRIKFYKEQIEKLSGRDLLPCRVTFNPISFYAMELEDFIPPVNEFEVNVTPGTKGQIFFLTRMAKRHKGQINSINNRTNMVESISGSACYPVKTPPMDIFLDITVDSKRIDFKKGPARKGMEALRQFCSKFALSDLPITDFYDKKEIALDGIRMVRGDQSFSLQFTNGSLTGKSFEFATQPNAWLENFVGYVIKNCGADDVFLSLKTRWNRPPIIQGKHVSHRSECDVGVRFGNNFYFISCKAGKNISYKKAALEIKSAARSLGRFAIPMLAVFKYSMEPKLEQGVWKFGYKTLADKNAMKGVLKNAAASSSTTAKRSQKP